ncbi:MAG TPA: glucose 1-dehydrogenase [Chloroflexota bacterium]|jgi:NAD(P)-dependent dehydrogenase (short-subunit alcohol dehydrogenase family)
MPILDKLRLDGRIALVTGASHGIGEGMALAFAEAGADLALAARSQPDLERVAQRVRELGRRAIVVPTDVADLGALQPLVDRTVGELGAIDVLANVAGVSFRKNILDCTLADWDYVLNIHLRSVYFISQAAVRVMQRQQRGKIINIASMNSYRGYQGLSLYGLAKAAVLQLTKTMAVEWAEHNIHVNAIAPGWIETPMLSSMAQSRKQWVLDHTPQHRMGSPEDIAGLALYLASPASDFVTGQTYAIDGGFTAGHPWPPLTS